MENDSYRVAEVIHTMIRRVKIRVFLKGSSSDYGRMIAFAWFDAYELRNTIGMLDIDELDMKTVHFSAEALYEHNPGDEMKGSFIGYEYRHILEIELKNDEAQIAAVTQALSACKLKPDFRIDYITTDKEER